MELDESAADTHLQIGHLHKSVGDIGAATQSYAHAARLDPKSHHARIELAALIRQNAVPSGDGTGDHEVGLVDGLASGTISGWVATNRSGQAQKTVVIIYQGHDIGQVTPNRYRPAVVAEHHESFSRGDDMSSRNFGRFVMEDDAGALESGACQGSIL